MPAAHRTSLRFKQPVFNFLSLFIISISSNAQKTTILDTATTGKAKTVIAGSQYKSRWADRLINGNHYRREWTSPIKVPILDLDSAGGGLTAVNEENAFRTKTLILKGNNGSIYLLRKVNKDVKITLPDASRGTFIQNLAQDQLSMAHPFAPVAIPILAKAAGVYYTWPVIVLVTRDKRLGKYATDFTNTLCLLEEWPQGNQQNAANVGFSKNVISTDLLLRRIFAQHKYGVDQKAFVKARLFDMLLGDWDQGEDQWRWASFQNNDQVIYKPVPVDRSEAFSNFDGLLPYLAFFPSLQTNLSPFKGKIKNLKKFNAASTDLDHQFTNEVSKAEWIAIAKELQQALTDTIIEEAIRQMPPEIFKISGKKIIATLQMRRNHLVTDAERYYKDLSKVIDLVGTQQKEYFTINRLDKKTEIKIYKNINEQAADQPLFARTFFNTETQEIRLHGLAGSDYFKLTGTTNKGITIRIIGGAGKDSIINKLADGLGENIKIYNDPESNFTKTTLSQLEDTTIDSYSYKGFQYSSGHTVQSPSLSQPIGITVGAGYAYTQQQWRNYPFAWQQSIRLYYSITQNSIGIQYKATFNHFIGKWNLAFDGNFDAIRQSNFFGYGNETVKDKKPDYYRLYDREAYASVAINKQLSKHQFLSIATFYHPVKILPNIGRYASDAAIFDPSGFKWKQFAGARVDYFYNSTNDDIIPTKGLDWLSFISYTQNLLERKRSAATYSSAATLYVPLASKFSLSITAGGATLTGTPEFYQLNTLGGSYLLRGYRRNRFIGETSFYNSTELRWIINTRNHLFNGKFGILALVDNGRVWLKGEASNQWHYSYGGGILLAPFHLFAVTATYAQSRSGGIFGIRVGRSLSTNKVTINKLPYDNN